MAPKRRKTTQKAKPKDNSKRARKLEPKSERKCEIPAPPGFCLFQNLFNKGLDHVARHIFSYLDHPSISHCMLACRDFETTLRGGVLKTERYRLGEIAKSSMSDKRPPMVDFARLPKLMSQSYHFGNTGWYVVHCDGDDLYLYLDSTSLYKFVNYKLVNSAQIKTSVSNSKPELACGPGVVAIMTRGDRYHGVGKYFTSITLVSKTNLEMLSTVEMRFNYYFPLKHSLLLIDAPYPRYEEVTLHNVIDGGSVSNARKKKLYSGSPSYQEYEQITNWNKFAADDEHVFAATWTGDDFNAKLHLFKPCDDMEEIWSVKVAKKYDVWVALTNTYACAFLHEKSNVRNVTIQLHDLQNGKIMWSKTTLMYCPAPKFVAHDSFLLFGHSMEITKDFEEDVLTRYDVKEGKEYDPYQVVMWDERDRLDARVLGNKVEHLTLLSESVLLLWRWNGFVYLMDISNNNSNKPNPIYHPLGVNHRIMAVCKDGLIVERNHKVGRHVLCSKLSLACICRTRKLHNNLIEAELLPNN